MQAMQCNTVLNELQLHSTNTATEDLSKIAAEYLSNTATENPSNTATEDRNKETCTSASKSTATQTAFTWHKIQELHKEIDALKSENRILKSQVNMEYRFAF